MGTRILSLILALGALSALLITGCSEAGSQPGLTKTGKVRVVMATTSTRAGQQLPTDLEVLFNGIDILTPTTSSNIPWDQLIPPGSTNPNLPIPILDRPTLVNLVQENNPKQYIEVCMTEVPAGMYDRIRVVLDDANIQDMQNWGLPFNPQSLGTLIPISGGMQVGPDETVTLMIDLFLRRGYVVGDAVN